MKRKGRDEQQNIIKIGVCGIHAKAGATHVSHMIALYLTGCRRKKVAVTECDKKASLRYLERDLFGSEGEGYFLMRRCIYRYNASDQEEKADYQVYDLGSGNDCRYDRLFSCDLCVAVGSGGVFCSKEWENFFQVREVKERIRLRGLNDWRFLKNHAKTGCMYPLFLQSDKEREKITVYGLGAEENLLHLSKPAQKLMKQMEIYISGIK